MRKFGRFAASFLSLALGMRLDAADLRAIRDPAAIGTFFPAAARVRVLNVWATWCLPCIAEMPDLRAVDEAFGSEVAIVGVSLDHMIPDAKREKVIAFLDRQKVAFTNAYYMGNADELGDHLQFSGEIPVTIVYDRRGKEVWRHQGQIRKKVLIAVLRNQLSPNLTREKTRR